tara:strand:+ start:10474 stop:10833 length:360 start_codon:yes stop_codon:yes gene_type:complete
MKTPNTEAEVASHELFAVIHDEHPEGEREQAVCMAMLVPAPELPDGAKWGANTEPFMIACVRHAGEPDFWEWAAYDHDNWREMIGDALLSANVPPGVWRWVTIHPANAEVSHGDSRCDH